MPRRDGLPTNRELQLDFTAKARDVFVTAAERELEGKITPLFEDKPLDHLRLTLSRKYNAAANPEVHIYSEHLDIEPLPLELATNLAYSQGLGGYGHDGNELFRGVGDEELQRYEEVARTIGGAALTSSLRFRSAMLTSRAVNAVLYTQKGPDSPIWCRAGSFTERTSKKNLTLAQDFAEDATAYVTSDDFAASKDRRLAEAVLGQREYNPYDIYHRFNLRITPELPLNGHEPERFIHSYHQRMAERVEVLQLRLEQHRRMGASQSYVDDLAEQLDRYQKAKDAAEKYV